MRKLNNFNIICIVLMWCYLCYIIVTETKEMTFSTWMALFFSAALVFIPIGKHYIRKRKE